MSKVTRKRLRELAMIGATATPDEVRALVLEVKGARAMIERFEAALLPVQQRSCVCGAAVPAGVELDAAANASRSASVLN